MASGKNIVNYEQKCEDWYYNQNLQYLFLQIITTLSCPCDRRLARFDRRWKKDRYPSFSGSPMTCYYQRNLRVTRATQVHLSCIIYRAFITATYQPLVNIYANTFSLYCFSILKNVTYCYYYITCKCVDDCNIARVCA